MQRFDKLVLLTSLAVLSLWVVQPSGTDTGVALALFALLHLARLVRWQGHHTFSEPLVWVLHVSYAFIPAGALVLALDQLAGRGATAAAQHLWMSGAIGAMTLAVMTRATLGHTGQALRANRVTVAVYLCLFGSVLTRLGGSAVPALGYVSGVLWLLAFGGFVVAYGPLLWRAKLERPA